MDAKIYDFATVATFSLCLVLLHRRKWNAFHAVYILACLNRETAFLLTVFFALHFFWRLDARTYLTSIITQGLIFLSIRLILLVAFRDNPGVVAQMNLLGNFKEFADNPLGTVIIGAIFAITVWLVVQRWQTAPVFLKDILLTFTPLLVVLWLLFGRSMELRVFVELFPALYAIIVCRSASHLNIKVGDLRT